MKAGSHSLGTALRTWVLISAPSRWRGSEGLHGAGVRREAKEVEMCQGRQSRALGKVGSRDLLLSSSQDSIRTHG